MASGEGPPLTVSGVAVASDPNPDRNPFLFPRGTVETCIEAGTPGRQRKIRPSGGGERQESREFGGDLRGSEDVSGETSDLAASKKAGQSRRRRRREDGAEK